MATLLRRVSKSAESVKACGALLFVEGATAFVEFILSAGSGVMGVNRTLLRRLLVPLRLLLPVNGAIMLLTGAIIVLTPAMKLLLPPLLFSPVRLLSVRLLLLLLLLLVKLLRRLKVISFKLGKGSGFVFCQVD